MKMIIEKRRRNFIKKKVKKNAWIIKFVVHLDTFLPFRFHTLFRGEFNNETFAWLKLLWRVTKNAWIIKLFTNLDTFLLFRF